MSTCTVSTQPVGSEDGVSQAQEDSQCCWICLGDCCSTPLVQPCRCPRTVHSACIARWQLQSAGTRRETRCEFCSQELPDWRHVLTPATGLNLQAACMNVNFFNKVYSFKVAPGTEGYQEFTMAIRKSFSLPTESELNITFTCDEPSTGALLTLQGAGAYDAAVYCAAISAARRAADGEAQKGTSISKRHSNASLLSIDQFGKLTRRLAVPISVASKRLRLALSEFLW